jgi:hypothetical protein
MKAAEAPNFRKVNHRESYRSVETTADSGVRTADCGEAETGMDPGQLSVAFSGVIGRQHICVFLLPGLGYFVIQLGRSNRTLLLF